ncbi:MAG TPA: Asp-tRNA(Asn)/Glu-tRNA(Gln) amidotransferase subunit GatC [Virgibacillus sp.]|nr:Asp-tRNA(Asn)/Glu-tRNA(Gln) amidotransferase subunit GatC [Virgibacillus sp.]
MAKMSKDQVKHVAELARLNVTDDEVAMFEEQLSDIIAYVEKLNEVDTTDVKPTTHVLEMTNVMRKDKTEKGLTQEEALGNAPSKQDGQFKVPSILE